MLPFAQPRLDRGPFFRGRQLLLLVAVICLVLASACGGGNKSTGDKVTVQLDWTPNTNHIGIYIALAKGWYKDAGLDVSVLPYSDLNPDTVVANGNADVGISFPANVVFSRAAGLDVVSIAAVLQHNVTELAVLDSSDIQRPRDLDGKTYAGFGLPYEVPSIRTVIQADGGTGDFKTATLSTAAYDALYNGRADFTEIFTTWEGIEAQLRGIKLRTFKYQDYGLPDYPSVVLETTEKEVQNRPDVLRKFLSVTRRGYEYAAQHPDEAAQEFVDYVGKDVFPEQDLVKLSDEALAGIFVDSTGTWGLQSSQDWDAYTKWLLDQNIVTDQDGKVVTQISGGPLYTNQLLSSQ